MKKRILICGGRNYTDNITFKRVIEYLRPWFADTFCVIQGGAKGADQLAKAWSIVEGCPMIEVPANWDKYGKSAGSIRNRWMLEYGMPDLVVAFPGGTGTENMVKRARTAKIDVFEVT